MEALLAFLFCGLIFRFAESFAETWEKMQSTEPHPAEAALADEGECVACGDRTSARLGENWLCPRCYDDVFVKS